jgi:hypothetical protein
MADVTTELLKTEFRQLRLPTMSREFDRLARDANERGSILVTSHLPFSEWDQISRASG